MSMKLYNLVFIIAASVLTLLLLNSCSLDDADIERAPPNEDIVMKREREMRGQFDPEAEEESFLRGLFDNAIGRSGAGSPGINVNTYLWRASLDTLSFMPLLSADPFGGVIITDWHTNSETSKEKYKIVTYILGKDLRVDALRVSVFKKVKNADNEWVETKTNTTLARKIEDAILTNARKYKIENID